MPSLTDEYLEKLRRYVNHPDDSGLGEAYEIARKCLDAGKGLGDMASLHQEALVRLAAEESHVLSQDDLGKAGDFFYESLGPFEMIQRGYAENIQRLNDMYAEVRKQKEEVSYKAALLQMTNQELESFCYAVSHDLKAPLRHIEGFSQILQEDLGKGLDREHQDYFHRIGSAIRRMNELIDDLLGLSRITAQTVGRSEIDLGSLAKTVFETMAAQSPARSVELRLSGPLPVRADPGLLRIALENLLGNAWKYTGKRTQAVIEVGALTGEPPVYYVRDNGAGFHQESASKLFTPFQRLHSATDFPGTGIGLATVARIIHKHQGRIWAEAREGLGATFFFTLDHGSE